MNAGHFPDPPAAETRLRAEIRDLGTLLGQTLSRHEGDELLGLVEEVRRLAREDQAAAAGFHRRRTSRCRRGCDNAPG